MTFQTVLGTQTEKPQEIDTQSSESVIYIRKNIQRYEVEEDEYNPAFSGWKYEEAVVPNVLWVQEKLKEQQEVNETLMLAIADLYEAQLEVQNG